LSGLHRSTPAIGERPLGFIRLPESLDHQTVLTAMNLACTSLTAIGLLIAASGFSHAADQAPRWTQSYNAGYTDSRGAYAGGSEIMHLVSHKGKLYAANGYWVDARWEIPPDAKKQSAQVLRLDSADGRWQVDLDLGKTNGLGLHYMKGNILKSVTFTRDRSGKLLPQPKNLLVMAAGANFERGGAVSTWVRDDSKDTWTHTLVRHGSNAGGVRWVPRDMHVFRDKVTGVERLFLLLGNPGMVSGVYDPTLPGKVRWEKHVEFPFLNKGSLKTRPLGIAVANGSLFFSAGSSIYRRNDGRRPTYTKVLDLAEDTDTDVGGIRGLTSIDRPKGRGESLLFLWAPGGRSKSQVKRLDPNASGGYTVFDEANMADLMSKRLGVSVSYTLGAHNMMYPIEHPVTGKTVHLIGFQGNIHSKDHLRWKGSRLYAGAMYAIRHADQTYTVHEVNNAYTPGKAVLVSARTFCPSPFGDHHLYVGGHDSSNKISDNMGWIFKTPTDVALGARPGRDASPPRAAPLPAARLLKGPIYELRIYQAKEGRLQHLIKRFRDHTDRIFKKHGLEPVGYWTATDGTAREQRKFVYLLKHTSRYAAYKNWNAFSGDRQWQAVLDKPEFRGVLAEKPTSIFMTANDYSAASSSAIEKAGGVFELRTYTANQGKLDALNARFRDHTAGIFARHGIKSVAYWTPFDQPEASNTLIYLIHHAGRKQADANWKAFAADPAWQKVARQSQLDGKLLAKPPEQLYLKALDFSPLK
jgi:hypothetical protein